MASVYRNDTDETSYPVLTAAMGITPSVHQASESPDLLDNHGLNCEIMMASQALRCHLTFNESTEKLYRQLNEIPRPKDKSDLRVVIHRVPAHIVNTLLDNRNPSMRVLYAADDEVLIVTLTGQIHSIINAWLIGELVKHNVVHNLENVARLEARTNRSVYQRVKISNLKKLQCDTRHLPSQGSASSSGKEPDLILRRKFVRGPSLIVEIGVSERYPDLRCDAKWWLANVEGVKVVLLVGYNAVGKFVSVEKWVSISVDKGARSGSVRQAVCQQMLSMKWNQETPTSNPTGFSICPGSTDPLLIGSAAELLGDITIPPTKDYTLSSAQLQQLVEEVYNDLFEC